MVFSLRSVSCKKTDVLISTFIVDYSSYKRRHIKGLGPIEGWLRRMPVYLQWRKITFSICMSVWQSTGRNEMLDTAS